MAEIKTNEIGLFNYACSYLKAAQALVAAKVRSSRAEMPIRFLYYHAIELLLKSFLVLHGYSDSQLRKIGHLVNDLASRSAEKGLPLDDEDSQVIGMMADPGTIIDSRYIRVGYFQWPSVEALDRTTQSLFRCVRRALRDAGHKVR